MADHPPALPHGPIAQLFPGVFFVAGSFTQAPLVSFPRNMVVLRDGDALTVVNPVRLDSAGEAALAELGEVRHVVRLGVNHSRDDRWYRDRYKPRFWSSVPTESDAQLLVEGGPSPCPRASVFVFSRAKGGEAALILDQPEGNLLITCDSVQNWVDTRGCSFLAALLLRGMGFITPAKIGPIWLDRETGGHPAEMRPDFERLLDKQWSHLVAAHGVLLRDNAKSLLQASCDRVLKH